MSVLLGRSSRRHARQHPGRHALAILGVALGVAVVLGIDLSLASARTAFEQSTRAVSGPVSHQIVGGPTGLALEVGDRVKRWLDEHGALAPAGRLVAQPVVEGPARVENDGRATVLRLVGVEIEAAGSERTRLLAGATVAPDALGSTTHVPILLTAERARALALELGESFTLSTASGRHDARLAVILRVEDRLRRQALDEVAFTSLDRASRLLGTPGRLTRIDLVPESEVEGRRLDFSPLLGALAEELPPGARLVEADSRRESTLRMTEAFELNLRALSLLALLCGAFLVYGTVHLSVVERRAQIGLLRALGVSRRTVLTRVLLDVGWVGLVGALGGVVGGIALAQGLVRLVTRTVSDLYFTVAVQQLELDPWQLLEALVLGVGISAVAGLRPALEATRIPPRIALSAPTSAAASQSRGVVLGGVGLLALGSVALALAGRHLVASFAALFVAILGFALLVPALVAAIVRLLEPWTRQLDVSTRMAARGIAHSLGRTGVALAALTLAVATTIGVGVMVQSFRDSVSVWLGETLRHDLYLSAEVAPGSGRRGERVAFSPMLLEPIARLPGVHGVHTVRRVQLDSGGEEGPLEVTVLDTDLAGFLGYRLLGGERDDHERVWRALLAGEALASEPLAYHRRLAVGEPLTLPADDGPLTVRIAAVYRDYSSDRGEVLLHRRTWDRHFEDRRIDGASISVVSGTSQAQLESLRDRVAVSLPTSPPFEVRSARGLREAALAVFDQTFVITGVLRLLAGVVAFLGVLSALLALLLERRRQHAVLRAIGMRARELRRLLLVETATLGALAGLLAVPLGLALAWAMIAILNRRSFGWSMEMVVAPSQLLQGVGLACGAALLAGLVPARQLSRVSPAAALREE